MSTKRVIFWVLAVLGLPVMSVAQPHIEHCDRIAWDYAPHAQLGFFRLYASQTSGVYPIDKNNPSKSSPNLVIPAIPTLVTEMDCKQLRLTREGTWYVVLTAVSKDMTIESDPSNEVSVTYRMTTDLKNPNPPGEGENPLSPYPPIVIPKPYPPITIPPYKPPALPPSTSNSERISDTCAWQGNCPR